MVCAPVRRDNPRALARALSAVQAHKPITSVDLAHYGVSRAKDWVFVDCGTQILIVHKRSMAWSARNVTESKHSSFSPFESFYTAVNVCLFHFSTYI